MWLKLFNRLEGKPFQTTQTAFPWGWFTFPIPSDSSCTYKPPAANQLSHYSGRDIWLTGCGSRTVARKPPYTSRLPCRLFPPHFVYVVDQIGRIDRRCSSARRAHLSTTARHLHDIPPGMRGTVAMCLRNAVVLTNTIAIQTRSGAI